MSLVNDCLCGNLEQIQMEYGEVKSSQKCLSRFFGLLILKFISCKCYFPETAEIKNSQVDNYFGLSDDNF